MGKIAVHEFISLDGVYENPSWTAEFGFDPKMGETIGAITSNATAILLGRKTYEMFYPAWSTRTAEEDPGAPFFNDTKKYVVSSSLTDPEWNNSEVVSYDQVRALKDSEDGDIYISGSGTLVRALLADGLVDELHLFMFPIALGAGEKLFLDGGDSTKLALQETDPYANGVVHLSYGLAA
jgi:dihydrofolate reductase